MTVRLFVGTAKGGFVFSSDEKRRVWKIHDPIFKGWKVTAVDWDQNNWFVGTASDVYGATIQTSSDLEHWQQIERGPQYPEESPNKLREIWTLNVRQGRYLAGVADAGLFESQDGGESWQPLEPLNAHQTREAWCPGAGGLCAHSTIVDPANRDRLWCGISSVGVFRSDDGGATWHPKNRGVPVILEDENYKDIGFCVHALVAKRDNADHIFRQDHLGMFRTTDAGDTWTLIENGLPSSFGFPIVMDQKSQTLFNVPLESDEYRLPINGQLQVYRSTNDGDSWESASNGLPAENYHGLVLRSAMATDQLDQGGVYFGTSSGDVFYSLDLGETWQSMNVRLPRIQCVEVFVE